MCSVMRGGSTVADSACKCSVDSPSWRRESRYRWNRFRIAARTPCSSVVTILVECVNTCRCVSSGTTNADAVPMHTSIDTTKKVGGAQREIAACSFHSVSCESSWNCVIEW